MATVRKICVFIGSRANYSSIKSVMRAVQEHPGLELQVLVGASALLDRFGSVVDLIKSDGFAVSMSFHSIVEGETPVTMATSTGLGMIEAAQALNNLNPDFVIIVGDRFEMMSVALAASYMNIPIAHTMGGEVTGTIDESVRHALTKLSHVHFPANEDARERIIKMGEDPSMVFNSGCPRLDLVREELETKDSLKVLEEIFEKDSGVGEKLDLKKPFILVSQHPVTTEFGQNRDHMNETLNALDDLKMNTLMLWPNVDAGSDEVSRAIRVFREKKAPKWLHIFKNLPVSTYIHLMNTTSCLVGNSSSGIREGAYIGTPVVNLGTRQNKRLSGKNVLCVGHSKEEILSAIKKQLNHGKYPRENIYGDGQAGRKIAQVLSEVHVNIQKTIHY